MRTRTKLAVAIVAAGAATSLALGLGGGAAAGAGPGAPNIVVILTDDQTSYELDAMPQTEGLIGAQGVNFSRFYASYPLCCPSRATLLTGLYMHNHRVRGNEPPFGGHGRFSDLGTEARDLPTWLKAAGYNTAHIGKYLNGYPGNGVPTVPPGWDEWDGQISTFDAAEVGGKLYYDYDLLEKQLMGGPATLHHYAFDPADYQTDVLQAKAVDALGRLGDETFLGSDQPFYLEVATSAPHFPYVPAPRYAGTMAGAVLPKLAGLNEKDVSDKPRFLRSTKQLTTTTLASLAAGRRSRLEQLRSVDDAVAAIVAKLAAEGELANTYIIFTSDNGYFFGEHRIANGKYLPYEPSARVPFLIRGPGIPTGGTSAELSGNIDVAPTVSALTGASPPSGITMDGRSLLPFATDPTARTGRPLLLEGDIGAGVGPGDARRASRSRFRAVRRLGLRRLRGVSDLEQEPGTRRTGITGDEGPAYRAIRTNRYLLVAYNTGEVELYDMAADPAQLISRSKSSRYKRVRRVLLNRLLSLSSCRAAACQVSYAKDPKPRPKHKRRGRGKRR